MIIAENDSTRFLALKRALWKAGATARVWWVREEDELVSTLTMLQPLVQDIFLVLSLSTVSEASITQLKQVASNPSPRRIKLIFIAQGPEVEERTREEGADLFLCPSPLEGMVDVAQALQQFMISSQSSAKTQRQRHSTALNERARASALREEGQRLPTRAQTSWRELDEPWAARKDAMAKGQKGGGRFL